MSRLRRVSSPSSQSRLSRVETRKEDGEFTRERKNELKRWKEGGRERNERIAVGSGEKDAGCRRGDGGGSRGGGSVKEKGVHGRWVVIFVPASSLISPHLLRAAALTPRRAATPGRGAVALVGVRLS